MTDSHVQNIDPIEVVPYQEEWPGIFRVIASELRRALGSVALRIDHVGSTSVPGLSAKPIIDIQVSVDALEPTAPYRTPLESLGYVFKPENPERTKRHFREPAGARLTNVSVRRAGSWNEQFALLSGDYLRNHPDEVASYARLKSELAARYALDPHAYADAKRRFIWQLMARADSWAQSTGWQPGPSDA